MITDKRFLENFIAMALAEDIGTGDITTLSTIPEDSMIEGRFLAKAIRR
jgi:nicotinate-nucleotide pyrophosphorylase (carboxylating)